MRLGPDRTFRVLPGEEGRLDRDLSRRLPEYSRSRLQRFIESGMVLVGGERARSSRALRAGETIQVWLPADSPARIAPDPALRRRILFEDDHFIVLNKPAGLAVHPAGRTSGDTLIERLVLGGPRAVWADPSRPGIVHRLDKDTTGVMVLARTPQVQAALSSQFAERKVQKVYLALVDGVFKGSSGTIESCMGRDPRSRSRFAVTGAGRWAATDFKVLRRFARASYLEVRPRTGRTHQIRVHLAHLGHPVLGDLTYGRPGGQEAPRQMLHSYRLTLKHPARGRTMTFEAPIPKDFASVVSQLKREK